MSECFSLAFGVGTQNSAGQWLEVFYPQPHLHPAAGLLKVIADQLGYAGGNQALELRRSQCEALSSAIEAAGFAEAAGVVAQLASSTRPLVCTVLATDEAPTSTPETLSKGFKRRVGLAQAILHDPAVLILDEPTDGLDPNQKHQVRNLIKQLASGSNKIVVISTHILEEVSAVCTRAVVIAHGKLLADGTPDELEARSRYHQAVTVALQQPVDGSPLLALPGVLEVETQRDGRLLTVLAKPGEVIFPAVGEFARTHQWPVQELSVERGRLDEVFRTLTEKAA